MKRVPTHILSTMVILSIGIGGVFLFVGSHDIAQGAHARLASYVSGEATELERESINETLNWMREVVRSQRQEIARTERENQDLRRALASSSPEYAELVSYDYEGSPRRILLVAGHTAETEGTSYRSLSEYELNYQLMNMLEERLRATGYEVITTHEGDDYNEEFTNFFETQRQEILDFRSRQREAYEEEYPLGVVTNDTDHNYASNLGTLQLYGVNYWANQNNIDVVLHIHFNDYPGRPNDEVGEHTGFSVFTSLKTNKNFIESFLLAKEIEREMLTYADRSTVRRESAGVLESELIAVGQANSTDMPSLLLEMGFIYENKFVNPISRAQEFQDYTQAITQALNTYFARN